VGHVGKVHRVSSDVTKTAEAEKRTSVSPWCLGAEEAAAGAAAVSAPSSSAVFSRLDMFQLERVVGTARAKKMAAPEANSTFIFMA